jgi:hypothetical protein
LRDWCSREYLDLKERSNWNMEESTYKDLGKIERETGISCTTHREMAYAYRHLHKFMVSGTKAMLHT